MDPLSVAASIAGLVKAATEVSSIVSKIAASRTSGFKEVNDVRNTVETLRSVLVQIQTLLLRSAKVDHKRASMILVDEVVATLTGCVMTFSDLDKCVKGMESEEKLGVLDTLRWATRVPELKGYLLNLEAHKSSLTLMLSILTCQSSQNAETAASELKILMIRVLESNEDLARRMHLLESSDVESNISSEGESTSVSNDTIRGPSTLAEISASSGNAIQHIHLVHTFEEDLQSSWVYQRSRVRGPDNFSISGTTQITQAWSMLSGISLSHVSSIAVQALPITIEDLNNGQLYNVDTEDDVQALSTTNLLNTSRQIATQDTRPFRAMGPYKYTHKQLVKKGIIQRTNVPYNRQKNISFHFENPLADTFMISIHYKGRSRALLQIDFKLKDLLEMQKEGHECLDLEYVELNNVKCKEFVEKRFTSKKGWRSV